MLKLTYEPSVIYAVILLLNTVTDVNILRYLTMFGSFLIFLCPSFEELERKFNKNEQKMQQQRDELADLEKNVTDVREYIRLKVTRYNNCQ